MNEEETEIWRDVAGYEGLYKVSNLGNVKKCLSGRILKLANDKDGYKQIGLCKNGVRKTYKVHRLVAQAFIENPNNLPQVNHKDEDKANNNVNNLEFCTNYYNRHYGTAIDRMSKAHKKPILQYNKNENLLNEYPSIIDASKNTGINAGDICSVCKGKKKYAGGYAWRYKDN